MRKMRDVEMFDEEEDGYGEARLCLEGLPITCVATLIIDPSKKDDQLARLRKIRDLWNREAENMAQRSIDDQT